jgi:hypothetical protein
VIELTLGAWQMLLGPWMIWMYGVAVDLEEPAPQLNCTLNQVMSPACFVKLVCFSPPHKYPASVL